MSDNNVINEITQMMTDRNIAQNDVNEAMNLVMDMFKKKYIYRLQEITRSHRTKIQKNPTKEMQLLRSIKPFLDESRHKSVDSMIDTLAMMNVMQNMQKELNVEKSKERTVKTTAITENKDTVSIHEDGIYDLDEVCLTASEIPRSNDGNKTSEFSFRRGTEGKPLPFADFTPGLMLLLMLGRF